MSKLSAFLLLLAMCLTPACGGGSGTPPPDSVFTHPIFTAENAYSTVVDPNDVLSIVAPSMSISPEAFAELVDSGEYELVTEAGIQTAADQQDAQAALDRDAVLKRFGNDPDGLKLINRSVDPNDPRFKALPDGNVLFRAIQADPANGIEERWFPLGGSHVLDPGLLDATQRFPTLENQREMYAGFYENLPATYILNNQLPMPENVQQEDALFFTGLNAQLALDWAFLLPQAGPPPQDFPASWRDEEGAGTPLQPARGLDRSGPQGMPVGLWADVDFPLKWCATRVRDQGRRFLCSYFSVTAAVEARFAAKRGRWVNLCEQLLYNQAKRAWNYDSDHGEAGWPSNDMARMGINVFSYPYEREWDYNQCRFRFNDLVRRAYRRSCWANASGTSLYPGRYCSDTNHQSPALCASYLGFVFCATRDVGPEFLTGGGSSGIAVRRWFTVWSRPDPTVVPNPTARHDLTKLCLALKIPATFCFGVPASGFANSGAGGFCTIDSPEPSVGGAHCTVLLGYIRNADLPMSVTPSPSGGYYIGKNSWGTAFGDQGYFYVSEDWIDKYGAGMYAVSHVSG